MLLKVAGPQTPVSMNSSSRRLPQRMQRELTFVCIWTITGYEDSYTAKCLSTSSQHNCVVRGVERINKRGSWLGCESRGKARMRARGEPSPILSVVPWVQADW